MAITKTLYLLVALVLLQGALSMPPWRRQQQRDQGRQVRNGGGGRGGSSEEEGKEFFDICRIVNQTAGTTLCMEDSQCPTNSVCMADYVEDSVQFYSCLPLTCVPTTSSCPTGTNCTLYTNEDGTTQSYCLPEDFVADSGSSEYDFDSDEADDGASDDGADAGGNYDDGFQYYFGGLFRGRRKRQTMESCRRVLCRIHNQGRGGRDGDSEGGRGGRGGDDGQGGRGGNGGFFPRQTTPGQDQPEFPDQTTPEQIQPLFPGQNPGQNPELFRGFGRRRGQGRRGGINP